MGQSLLLILRKNVISTVTKLQDAVSLVTRNQGWLCGPYQNIDSQFDLMVDESQVGNLGWITPSQPKEEAMTTISENPAPNSKI